MNRNKNKTLVPLGIALVVLVGAVLLLANPFAKPKTDATGAESSGSAAAAAKVLIPAKKEEVTAISILQPKEQEFKLAKNGDSWEATLGDKHYGADQDKVDKLLEALPGLASESMASSNTEKYKDYGVDDESAVKVGIFTGGDKPAATLLVGNSAPGATASFARLGEDKQVWRTPLNVKALVGFSFKDYRSRKPWTFDPQIVKSLTVRAPGGKPDTYSFDNGVWKTASGANANQNLIVKLLEDWSKAAVNDFADDVTPGVTPATAEAPPAEAAGQQPPATPPAARFKVGLEPNLAVQTPQGSFSLTLGEKDGALYYVADQNKLVYKMAEPGLAFFRELKFDELKIPAAEDAAKPGAPAGPAGPETGKPDAGKADAGKSKPEPPPAAGK
jgi:hypothetical protein